MDGVAIAVLGGSGGTGASSLAAALAAVAARAVLVDLDPVGGGIDVLLGIEDVPGARWSGLRLDGGRLDPELLQQGLPRWGCVPVLAADVAPPDAAAVGQVLDAAEVLGLVVLDLPRAPSEVRDSAAGRCAFVAVVVGGGVRDLAAARAVVSSLPDVPVGLVLRRGPVAVGAAAASVGAPVLGVLPPLGRARHVLDPRRLPRTDARMVRGILGGLTA